MVRLELGSLSMTVAVKDHELLHGTPLLNILQDNLKEILPLVPDGTYRWVLVMDIDSAEKVIED